MANSDKDILITPNTGSSTADPKIEYVGADSSTNDTITVETQFDGSKSTLSFEGSAGQLFSVSNDLSGTLFAVNDSSGIPSIEVDSDGEIRLAEFSGNVGIGISAPTELLHVDGRIKANNLTLASLSAQNSEATAVMIDGSGIIGTRELGSNAFNSTSYLTGNQTITLSGDVSGSGTTSISVTVADDSHNHVISNIDGLQSALDGKQASGNYLTTSTTFGGDVSGTYSAIVVANDSHNHTKLFENSTITFGASQLQWMDQAGTGGTGLNGAAPRNPANGWYHNLIFNHANSGGYYSQIATGLNSSDIYFSRVQNGTAQAWQRIFADDYHPNADKWTTARTLSLTGAVTGSVSWDGSGNASMATTATADPTLTLSGDASGSATFTNLGNATLSVTVADDSHNHVISNVDGLQTALDAKAPVSTTVTTSGTQSISGAKTFTTTLALSAGQMLTLGDSNHHLVKVGTGYSGSTIDGPRLQGHQGGELATNINSNQYSLRWDSAGNIIVRGDGYFNGTKLEGDNKQMIQFNDSWLRLNPANEFTSGIYCGTGILRTDGTFQVGASGSAFSVTTAGNVNLSGLLDGRDVAADGTKLDTIATNADVTPSWVPSSDPSYLTSSSTQSKYVRSDTADTASGQITFSNGGVFATNGVRVYRQNTNSTIWFNGSSAADTNHALWNAYYGTSPTTRGAAGSGFDGMYWNTYRGLHIRGGLGGAVDCIKIQNSSGSTTDHTVTLYASNSPKLATSTSGVSVTGNIAVSGTVDGRDIASDGSKLDGIASGADVTPSWVPSSNPSYLTSSSTQSKYLRSDTSDQQTSGQITFNGGIHIGSTNTYIVQHVTNGLGFRVGTGNYYGLKIDPTAGHTETIKTGVGGAFNALQGVLQVKGDQTMNRGSFIRWANDAGGTGEYIYSKSSSPYDVTIHSGSYDALQCPNTGSVRINHNGSQKFVSTSSGVSITGNMTASQDVIAYSDEKLKDNVQVIENAIQKVKQVRGVTFTRNDLEDTEKRHTGVIAQEVEKVLPEVVNYETGEFGTTEIKTVAYGNMVGLLIEAIKEQQETIEKLTSRINDIEKGE